MKLIAVNGGVFVKVDNADYKWLNEWKWFAFCNSKLHINSRKLYVVGYRHGQAGRGREMKYMHRLIMEVKRRTVLIDHIDGDTLNNQRNNLRKCTYAENFRNSIPRISASKYKGVTREKRTARYKNKVYKYIRWLACIRLNYKSIHLGSFPFTDEGELLAANAYDIAAIKYHKKFARLNFAK